MPGVSALMVHRRGSPLCTAHPTPSGRGVEAADHPEFGGDVTEPAGRFTRTEYIRSGGAGAGQRDPDGYVGTVSWRSSRSAR